jgi:NDP-sugar pyrophosphorylase family protein
MHRRQVKINLGVIQCNGGNEIVGYIEKPTRDYMVSMGVYVFEPQILKYVPCNEYLDFPDLVQKLLASGEKVYGYPFDGYWQDLGNPEDYQQAKLDFGTMQAQFIPEE